MYKLTALLVCIIVYAASAAPPLRNINVVLENPATIAFGQNGYRTNGLYGNGFGIGGNGFGAPNGFYKPPLEYNRFGLNGFNGNGFGLGYGNGYATTAVPV